MNNKELDFDLGNDRINQDLIKLKDNKINKKKKNLKDKI